VGGQARLKKLQKLIGWWLHGFRTHIAWNICEGDLMTKLKNLWNVGYKGYYSVEHHSAKNEYSEVAIQLAKVRDVLDKLHTGND